MLGQQSQSRPYLSLVLVPCLSPLGYVMNFVTHLINLGSKIVPFFSIGLELPADSSEGGISCRDMVLSEDPNTRSSKVGLRQSDHIRRWMIKS